MAESYVTLPELESDFTETCAALVACRLLSRRVGVATPPGDASDRASHGAGSCQIIITVQAREADLEDVVAWTFVDSDCVHVRKQSIVGGRCWRQEEVDCLPVDDQASGRERSRPEARSGEHHERNRVDRE